MGKYINIGNAEFESVRKDEYVDKSMLIAYVNKVLGTQRKFLCVTRAKRHIPMTMEDWAKRIDAYLNSDERPLLTDARSVSHEAAQEYAETEFEKYRVIQDRLFESDFDRFALPTLPFEDNEEKLK
jgi:hypothetical protein